MTLVKRLRLLTAVLGAAALCAVVVNSVIGDVRTDKPAAPATPARPEAAKLIDELARTKFSDKATVTYKAGADTLFAWQVKPTLAAAPVRPRDIVVLVDTSASQAGTPLKQARAVLAALIKATAAADRLDIWTINIADKDNTHTRSLTRGLQSPTDKSVDAALTKLADSECGYGAVDLKAGLEAALKAFSQKPGRQQVMVYLGDGESSVGTPITEAVRVELGQKIADKDVQFFAVPIGMTISAENLHGLAVLTGGTVVRSQEDMATSRSDFVTRLTAAFDAPVLRPTRVTFGPNEVDLLPGKLPPLRADRATLVVGKLKGDAANLTCKIEGTVADRRVTVDLAERLPPSHADHYFLRPMYEQWKAAGHKDAPAMLAADRVLAQASVQFHLYREEFLELGLKAIASDRLDHAQKLFEASARIDPAFLEAKNGLDLVVRMRAGELNKDKIKQQFQDSEKAGRLLLAKQEPAQPLPPPLPGVNLPAPGGGIERAQAAKQIADQEATAATEVLVKRALRLKATEPDSAYEDLKRAQAGVRGNDAITDRVRTRLATDLENAMTDIRVQGAEIKRRNAADAAAVSRARNQINVFEREMAREKQTKIRIDRFHDLMNVAKFELAYQEAQVMAQERVNAGLPVPPEVLATYRIGQAATNLRELKELKRLREDRYLMCMLQVDKSFVPYPDEPPVHFPPAAVWRELTGERKAKYSALSLGANVPDSLRRLQSVLETKPVTSFGESSIKDMTLGAMKDKLEREFKEEGLKIIVREDLFRIKFADKEAYSQEKFRLDLKPNGMLLGNFLDVALLDLNASFIVRPDYIEITTTDQRLEDKVIRAYECVDLILAIPSSVNQATVQQNLQLLGAQLAILGQAQGQAQQLGGFGGGFGGQQGGFGGQQGGFGGQQGGFAGQMGGQQGGGQVGQVGNQGNLGVGGGIAGVNGGQLGQLGNLGGQFGIQGNDQSQFLTALIQLVVARGEWDSNVTGVAQGPPQAPGEEPQLAVPQSQLNSLGFYPPVRALVIRGSSRYHPVRSFKLSKPGGNLGAGGPGLPGRGQLADGKGIVNPVEDPLAFVKQVGTDPEKVWNRAFATAVSDPELVVGAAEALFGVGEYKHTAEVLKANLRHGTSTGEWTHEALTIALQESKEATVADVERAALSAVDLNPADPKAYLKAARAEFDLGRAEDAFGLCKRAAALEPNLPAAYANALVYAESGDGAVKTDSIHWAAANLLRRDWTADGVDYAGEAKARVARATKKLDAAGKKDEAGKLTAITAEDKIRDLLIEIRWQGPADLDLTVVEPNGSTCSALQKISSGGGVLTCDILEEKDGDRSERYTAAQAYAGKYKVLVSKVMGTAFGNTATVVVTKFPGTPKQEYSVHAIDLTDPKALEVVLDGGRRTELASVPADEPSVARLDTTAAPRSFGPTGFSGGSAAGTGIDAFNATNSSSPTTNAALSGKASVEGKFGGVTKNAPEMRFTSRLSADRTKLEHAATVVFAGPALDIPLPKLRLLPGGEIR